MTRRLMMMAAVAGVILPAMSRAQDLSKPAPVASSLPWKVNCQGLANVPLTADAVQALPLKLVTTLNCDQGLVVLSDAEGYTVNVRTADGKTGYIASMYLMKALPAKPAPRLAPSAASTNNGVARWRPGAKGCEQFLKDGKTVESLTANDVTVQVSLLEAGSKLRANVAIGNFSNLHVFVEPLGITLESKGAHARSMAYRDPAKLARAGSSSTGGGTAVNAEYRGTDFSPVFVSANAVERKPIEDLSRPKATEPASVPDQFTAEALKKGTVKPEGRTWGAVWFERDANSTQYVMRVPVDNQMFEFPLSLETTASASESNP